MSPEDKRKMAAWLLQQTARLKKLSHYPRIAGRVLSLEAEALRLEGEAEADRLEKDMPPAETQGR